MTKVKICGLTTIEHVAAAVRSGADAIGFVFAPSKRQVTLTEATQLARFIPASVKKVGVFVNATHELIEEAIRQVPLDCVQLHGNESNAFIEKISVPVIKAVGIRLSEDVEKAASYTSDYILVDAPLAGQGRIFDWALLATLQKPFILAGGLTIENVEEAIELTNPIMVDVSSGVETNGIKDSKKIEQFIQRAKKEAYYANDAN